MLRLILTGAGAIALASTAALADPNANMNTDAQTSDAPQYVSEPAQMETALTPLEVSSRADSEKLATAEFAAADVNKDGSIDETEFAALAAYSEQTNPGIDPAKATPSDKAFAAIAKGDGAISKKELIDARGKSFDAADANRDKALDALERQKFATLVAVRPANAGDL